MNMEQAQPYVLSGLDAVNIKLVRNLEEVDDPDNYFKPDMCHQVFGESESIFGYRNLKINLLYNAKTLHCYVNSSYESKIDDESESKVKPEDFMQKLNQWLPANYFTERNAFMKCVSQKQKLKPFGTCLTSFTLENGPKKGCEYEIYTCDSNEPGYEEFHQRMETLIVWFIDAANFIDTEDTKWRFFVLYEKEITKSSVLYYPVGYSTVYEYFSYPSNRRYRISQFIVFPPYQNLGLGTRLLETMYEYLFGIGNIYDITVEDPSEKFQMMRDYVDAKFCMALPSFNSTVIKADFNKAMIEEARERCKMNEKQARRIYEIIRLQNTDVDDPNDFNPYKAMIKSRLNAPFKKQQQNKTYSKLFKEESSVQQDHRLKVLEKEFQQLIKQYRHVIYRLNH